MGCRTTSRLNGENVRRRPGERRHRRDSWRGSAPSGDFVAAWRKRDHTGPSLSAAEVSDDSRKETANFRRTPGRSEDRRGRLERQPPREHRREKPDPLAGEGRVYGAADTSRADRRHVATSASGARSRGSTPLLSAGVLQGDGPDSRNGGRHLGSGVTAGETAAGSDGCVRGSWSTAGGRPG
jgi:hypothetical protein